jgi:hypothetical protein
MDQPKGLISVLLDASARIDERDDAAMDLSAYSEPEVEAALLHAARDPATPESVVASCGESLAELWVRRGAIGSDALESLPPSAREEAEAYLRAHAPSLLSEKPS